MAHDVILYPTRSYIKKHFGGRDKLYPFMELNTMDMCVWGPHDFIDTGSDGDCTHILGETTSTGSITGTVASTTNGICRVTTAATTNDYCYVFPNGGEGMKGGAFKGDNSCVTWARIAIGAAATSCHVEVGFTDVDSDAGAVSNLGGETNNAADCAVWCRDTGDGNYWQAVHSANTTTATKIEPATHTATAGAYEWLGVAIQEDNVKFMHMTAAGVPDYESAWQASAITGSDALIPWIGIKTLSANIRYVDIDYWVAWQRRYTTDD